MDASLRRAGRFDREFCLTVPDEKGLVWNKNKVEFQYWTL
jgi:SpoVK/Ycf46/Vps4 family AAA+-type ATPase